MRSKVEEVRLQGSPVCEGIAIGEPFFFLFADDEVPSFDVDAAEVEGEIRRYRRALRKSRQDVRRLQRQLRSEGALEAAAILESHLEIMQDPLITDHIEDEIRRTRKNTEYIFHKALSHYEERFNRISDEFFRERIKDIQDISRRILGHLKESVRIALADIPLNAVVFAEELVPSDTAEASVLKVGAFVTTSGGKTSHAAIVAKARGIPFVASVDFKKMPVVTAKSSVIVDGIRGEVILNPTKDTLAQYKRRQKERRVLFRGLERESLQEAHTKDGAPVRLAANIEVLDELELVHKYNGHGIGLFRSEYLLLQQDAFPSEEEQLITYRKILEKMRHLPVVIRTFDLGGDKFGDFEQRKEEPNPFLGCRAIRYMLKERAVFISQIRAILRASVYGDVNILLPMVSGLPELLEARGIIEEVAEELHCQGMSPKPVAKVGCMIEVPSAAILADVLAKHSDFFAIGTNDLVQYTLAVDRGNPEMGHLYTPSHPAVLRLIKEVVVQGKKRGIPVSVCGEVAAEPSFIALLLGLGVNELSVATRYIPLIKKIIKHTDSLQARRLADRALRLETAEEVAILLAKEYHRLPIHDLLHAT